MMNLNNQPTIDELARLFAARKDSLDDHLLWVSAAGDVHIDRMPPHTAEETIDAKREMRARFKLFRRGQGYVGKKAAADTAFVSKVLETLQQEWPALRERQDVKVIERLC